MNKYIFTLITLVSVLISLNSFGQINNSSDTLIIRKNNALNLFKAVVSSPSTTLIKDSSNYMSILTNNDLDIKVILSNGTVELSDKTGMHRSTGGYGILVSPNKIGDYSVSVYRVLEDNTQVSLVSYSFNVIEGVLKE